MAGCSFKKEDYMNYKLLTAKKYANKNYLKELIEMTRDNILSAKDEDDGGFGTYTKLDVISFGRMLEGQAHYHEVDQYYGCIGFEVEVETQFSFQDKPDREIGFYSVWIGKCHPCSPFTFEESHVKKIGEGYEFYNGYGDSFEVTKELMTAEGINKFITDKKIPLYK
jgi:hypothetical protein